MDIKDAELIARFLDDDREAVAKIDSWLISAALSFRRRLAADWDDLLQDLRLEVTRLLREGRFRGDSSLRTYLSRVASHAALNRIRAGDRWHIESIEDSGPSEPAKAGVRSEERDLLLRILAKMPSDCRRLWTLILEGYDYREMSRRLGVAEGTLRVRVLRCRRRAVEERDRLLGQS